MQTLMRDSSRALILLILAITVAFPAQAAYEYTAINYPSATQTQIFGINNAGELAGDGTVGSTAIPFVYDSKKNAFTVLPSVPGFDFTVATGINNPGTVVGGASDTSGAESGTLLDKGAYSLFTNPGFFVTEARGISNNGMVAGDSIDSTFSNYVGFLYDPKRNTFTNFLPSGATITQGVNSQGDIVGSVALVTGYPGSTPGFYGFVRHKDGSVILFRVQDSSTATRARGITESGLITGFFGNSPGLKGFVVHVSGKASYEVLTLKSDQVLAVPGATDTIAEGINDKGQVCGNADSQGFLATPTK